jgi:nucleotide-binding universal stress UspA family protein
MDTEEIDTETTGTTGDTHEIVVGFSASAASAAALRWAAAEGRRQDRSVRAVHVFDLAERADARLERPSGHRDADLSRRDAERVATTLDGTGAPVSLSVVDGALLAELVHAATGASVLVIGEAGYCRHRGLADELRERVTCQVVVVPAA